MNDDQKAAAYYKAGMLQMGGPLAGRPARSATSTEVLERDFYGEKE